MTSQQAVEGKVIIWGGGGKAGGRGRERQEEKKEEEKRGGYKGSRKRGRKDRVRKVREQGEVLEEERKPLGGGY